MYVSVCMSVFFSLFESRQYCYILLLIIRLALDIFVYRESSVFVFIHVVTFVVVQLH